MSQAPVLKNLQDAQELLGHASQALETISKQTQDLIHKASQGSHDPFIMAFTVFILACFVGYYVVWKVTPALHSPLMAVTNAISSVIIVGALLALGIPSDNAATGFGFFGVLLASINIFGGFVVTQRMLAMFSLKKKSKE